MAARDILSRRHERLYQDGKGDSITAARDTLSRRQERLHHGGTRDSITAARETQSRQHETLHHGGKRNSITAAGDILSRRHEAILHSGTRHSFTAARGTPSQRHEKMRKSRISKAPPLIFPQILEFSENVEKSMCTLPEKSKGCSLKSQIFAFSKIRKSMKNHEISEIAISRLSHFPTFLLSASFSPRRPSRESLRRPLDSENSWRNQRGWRQERLYHGGRRDSSTAAGETLARRQERL